MKEVTVENYLVEQVEKRGGFCPKTVWLGRRGCPDRDVYWPEGLVDKVETKRPDGGSYEPGQEEAHKKLAKFGIPVYLLNTKAKVDIYIVARAAGEHLPTLFSVPVVLPYAREPEWAIRMRER